MSRFRVGRKSTMVALVRPDLMTSIAISAPAQKPRAHATSDAANIECWPESRARAHVPFTAMFSRQPGHFSRELGDFLGNRAPAKCLETFRRTDHHLGYATTDVVAFPH
jgi:hypothetical protein